MTRFIHNSDSPPVVSAESTLTIKENGTFSYSPKSLILGDAWTKIIIHLNFEKPTDGATAKIASYSSSLPKRIDSFTVACDGKSASLCIKLKRYELIDFGVLVELTQKDGTTIHVFCDPQASNDPIKTC